MRELRRARQRFCTENEGTLTHHSFSYGAHYDPDNLGFGSLIALNTEHVSAGSGYDEHAHADVEILTWVLDGVLAHQDTTGAGGVIRPGVAQRLSAGHGVRHAERNASATQSLTFVQMMLRSDNAGAPEYAQAAVPQDVPGLHSTVAVHSPAELRIAVLEEDASVALPPAPRTLVHVTRGLVQAGGQLLRPGDELRTDEPMESLVGRARSEALVWLLF